MRIYIAAPFCRKSEARDIRALMRARNYTVTSTWIDSKEATDKVSSEILTQAAIENLNDLEQADTIVFLNLSEFVLEGQGGKHFECGYALAQGKHLIVVGQRSQVFHYHPSVTVCFSVSELFNHLRSMEKLERAHV